MNVNGKEINLTPTEGMREEAQRYRDWKADGEAGGTEVAARRATQILSGDELSVDTVREMNAWFARHEVDKQGEGFTPDEDGYPSKGRVAWAAWGGDPGQSWSKMKAEAITNAQDRSLRAGPDDLSRSGTLCGGTVAEARLVAASPALRERAALMSPILHSLSTQTKMILPRSSAFIAKVTMGLRKLTASLGIASAP